MTVLNGNNGSLQVCRKEIIPYSGSPPFQFTLILMTLNRRFLIAILIPTLLIDIGMGLGNAFIPLYARGLGASMAAAALISALMFMGQALTDLPGGWLVHRFGDKNMMSSGGVIIVLSMLIRYLSNSLLIFTFSVFLFGVGTSLVWISRMSWLKKEIRGKQRGSLMSLVGGSLRIATIIGPLAGGFIAERAGYKILFASQGLFSLIALGVILFGVSQTTKSEGSYSDSLKSASRRWKSGRGTILAAAAGIAGLTVLRTSRGILLPLWGGELGLSEGHIGIVMFAGGLVDASLFWISGIIMTRRGRKTAAIICTAGLALAIGLLPLARSFPALILLSALAGLGNAMGAGINLTISGDLAPKDSPAAFLSFWRFFMGFAGFGGPALAAWMISAAGNTAAPPVTAAVGFLGALLMAFFMKETRKH